MNIPKYVKVSEFYNGPGWFDSKSKITFTPGRDIVKLEDGIDVTNIIRYLKFNYLVDATKLVEPDVPVEEVIVPLVESSPGALLGKEKYITSVRKAEETTEAVVEEVVEGIEETAEEIEVVVEATQEEIKKPRGKKSKK